MKFDFDDLEKPLFVQIAEQIENGILEGVFPEGEQIPSSTEISVTYKLNPATINKGVGLLTDKGLVCKKRGIGMFVSEGARELIKEERSRAFYSQYIRPMLEEANKLSLDSGQIIEMIIENNKETDK